MVQVDNNARKFQDQYGNKYWTDDRMQYNGAMVLDRSRQQKKIDTCKATRDRMRFTRVSIFIYLLFLVVMGGRG